MLQAHTVITLTAASYRLQAQLAGSAYGLVWRAVSGDGRAVALKFVNHAQMLQAAPALQERWIESATREIDFLRSLAPWDERHIVRLLDSGTWDGLPVMALELMGHDLARHAAADSAAFDRIAILDWLAQINQALAKVHQYGWLYLDLKPANVLLSHDAEHVKLADFGTNRLRSALPPVHYSGTASWQAPEQFFPRADGSYATTQATDYFALGALFYYLVTGGMQLSFCHGCGLAYREGQHGGPGKLRQHALAVPTLQHEEAQRFVRSFDAAASRLHDATWSPAGDSPAALEALDLLRALLDADPARRPRHALDISRRLAKVRKALKPPESKPAHMREAGACP